MPTLRRLSACQIEEFLMPVFPLRIPIPERFHSDETEAPFSECLVCECSLLDASTEYLIEKAYRRFAEYDVQETVFEYAICMECHLEIVESFSEPSQQRCESYFDERVDLPGRAQRLLADPIDAPEGAADADETAGDAAGEENAASDHTMVTGGPLVRHGPDPEDVDLDDWLDACIVHGTAPEEMDEYQILGHCVGDEMLVTHLPLMIGSAAMDEVAQLLSNETLDELGGFRDEYFGLPPELKRDLSGPVLA
jgi:hypothetical protein